MAERRRGRDGLAEERRRGGTSARTLAKPGFTRARGGLWTCLERSGPDLKVPARKRPVSRKKPTMKRQRPIRRSRPTFTDQEALLFHSQGRPGKLEVVPTKPMATQRDLSLAYSPGVAVPVQGDRRGSRPRLRLHRPRQHGGGDLERHRDPRPRQSRRARLEAGDGRQGRPVQALRRRRFDRSRGRHRGRGRLHQLRCAISAPRSAASTSKTSRRPSASSSRSACAS